jgi:hypothetical protein
LSIDVLGPVVPPNVFLLSPAGITFVRLRREGKPGVAIVRRFELPAGETAAGTFGTPVFGVRAFAEAVAGAQRLVGGKLSRACVVFPDSWARTITLDFDTLPDRERDRADMVAWKIKKLLPGRVEDLEIDFCEIPRPAEGIRLLVSAAPRETLRSLEAAFAAAGVRVGLLMPATLALFNGLDARLSRAAGGDYLLLHRSPGTTSLLIAREGRPLFYRQKSALEAEDDSAETASDATVELTPTQRLEQEIRLSLSYYTESLGGGRLAALYICDEDRQAPAVSGVAVEARPLSSELVAGDDSLEAAVATHPEIWPALAALQESA